ncbi:hypothetical protein [Clostridium sp. CF012]|uniref:hypothetical protein n=1 Tax=Clostridium sp. CF012 TaxID=2843319 RepID=UPI001C0E82F1|nr:hypothetical protein [Clostridium sp. CF012]MBU3146327.1 hypothetical protein [Clostridium sp. CF012]
MKRKFIWAITIFIIITISILTYFYLGGTDKYQKVDIYTAENFNKEINNPIISINDKNTLKEISTIMKKSKKLPGILNVVAPEYILEIHALNKNMQTVYLWIGKDSVKGMYMYKDNTETGYSISKTYTQKIRKIVIPTSN